MGQKNSKNIRKTEKYTFSQKPVFDNFKWYLGGLGVSRGMAWTIQTDSLELWWDLVLHGMGEVDFHVFDILGKSLHHRMILGPPDGSLDLFLDTRGFWLNGLRRKSILKIDTEKQISREPGQPPQIVIFRSTREYHGNIYFFPFLLSMDFPWIFHGFPHGISHGFSLVFPFDFPWIFHGSICHEFSMNYNMFPW